MANPSNQRPNGPSQPRKQSSTKGTSTSSGRNGNSRYNKKRRGGKPKPAVKRAPLKEYISACCGVPARKPRCGQEVAVVNPETKKPKNESKGLGHWRCTGCGKATKVRPQAVSKPQGTEVVTVVSPPGVLEVDVTATEAPVATA